MNLYGKMLKSVKVAEKTSGHFYVIVLVFIKYHREILKTVKVIKKTVNRLVFEWTPFN